MNAVWCLVCLLFFVSWYFSVINEPFYENLFPGKLPSSTKKTYLEYQPFYIESSWAQTKIQVEVCFNVSS